METRESIQASLSVESTIPDRVGGARATKVLRAVFSAPTVRASDSTQTHRVSISRRKATNKPTAQQHRDKLTKLKKTNAFTNPPSKQKNKHQHHNSNQ
ncbi:hypothetical protein BDW74DRAFT_154048 [Aspergillus multicolor]|uniref:uncharacterized protein n=1 Tax=Aspergillus multicolor TaxID=41759 RepID=UPI003CCCB212